MMDSLAFVVSRRDNGALPNWWMFQHAVYLWQEAYKPMNLIVYLCK